ncbi:MAG: hypothetical protein ACXVZ1_10690 [Gaiellaceae bacterium]
MSAAAIGRRSLAALSTRGRRLGESLATRRGLAILFVLSLVVYAVESLAWPTSGGRDFSSYVDYYAKMWQLHPPFPETMLNRGPVTPVVVGLPLDLGGGYLLALVMACLFAVSVLSWVLVARRFGPLPALLMAAGLLLYPSYAVIFHAASSDAVFATAFALWSLGFVRVARKPSIKAFALLGLGIAVLTLIRPVNELLVLVAAFALVLPLAWRARLVAGAAFVVAVALPLLGFAWLNSYRSHDFTVARGGGAVLFYRAFIVDRIVSPDNGPNSRELARVVRRRLLKEEPYRSYGITLKRFFSSGSVRMERDAYTLSDQVWGWNSDYSKLQAVALEAIRRHPGTFAAGVSRAIWKELTHPLYLLAAQLPATASAQTTAQAPPQQTIVVDGRRLPKPTEGEPIPAAHQGVTTPDNSVREVWTSPTEHHFVFSNRREQQRGEKINAEDGRLVSQLPPWSGSSTFALFLNRVSHVFPPAGFWLLVGVVATAWRRPRGGTPVVALVLIGLFVIVVSALGNPPVIEYAIPFVPAFALLALYGLLAPRRRPLSDPIAYELEPEPVSSTAAPLPDGRASG